MPTLLGQMTGSGGERGKSGKRGKSEKQSSSLSSPRPLVSQSPSPPVPQLPVGRRHWPIPKKGWDENYIAW